MLKKLFFSVFLITLMSQGVFMKKRKPKIDCCRYRSRDKKSAICCKRKRQSRKNRRSKKMETTSAEVTLKNEMKEADGDSDGKSSENAEDKTLKSDSNLNKKKRKRKSRKRENKRKSGKKGDDGKNYKLLKEGIPQRKSEPFFNGAQLQNNEKVDPDMFEDQHQIFDYNGRDGRDGQDGRDGRDGQDGQDGKNVYGNYSEILEQYTPDNLDQLYLNDYQEKDINLDKNLLKRQNGQDGRDGQDGQDGQDGRDGQDVK